MKQDFDIQGMSCAACSSRIEKSVSKLEGIHQVSVNLLTNHMQVDYDENQLDNQKIIDCVVNAGYGATLPKSEMKVEKVKVDPALELKNRFLYSLVFMLPLFYVSMGHMMGLPLPSILLGHENAMIFALLCCFVSLAVIGLNGYADNMNKNNIV